MKTLPVTARHILSYNLKFAYLFICAKVSVGIKVLKN